MSVSGGSVEKLPSGRYRLSFYVNGRRVRSTGTFPSEEDARANRERCRKEMAIRHGLYGDQIGNVSVTYTPVGGKASGITEVRPTPWVARKHTAATDRKLLWKYGINRSQWYAILRAQGGLCAMTDCRTNDPGNGRSWSTDHDHKTGKVRGLLCHDCNIKLGFFESSRDRGSIFQHYLDNPTASAVLKPEEGL